MKLRKWRKLQTNSHSSNRHSSHHGEKVQLMASKVHPMMTKKTLDRDDRSMTTKKILDRDDRSMMTKKILDREDRSMMTKKTMSPYVEYRPVPRPPSNLQQNSSQAQPLDHQLKIHFKNMIFTCYNPSDCGNLRKSSRSTISSMKQLETHDPFILL